MQKKYNYLQKKYNYLRKLYIFLIACLMLISGCSQKRQDTIPPKSTNLQENGQSNLEIDKLPNTVEKKIVVVQDYSNNDTSKQILNDFADAINDELAKQDPLKDHLKRFGKELYIINAAVPFDEGFLICGNILKDGEAYCNLYYLEDSSIIYRTLDSDVWSLNYTVFREHTITYGKSLGWDNGIIMQDKVDVHFADGQKVSLNFSNIPLRIIKSG